MSTPAVDAGAPLVVCAQAGGTIGAGHVMRCIALAEAWRDAGGTPSFLLPAAGAGLVETVRARGFPAFLLDFDPAAEVDRLARAVRARARADARAWAVLDGYDFTPESQRALRAGGLRLLVIDDNGHLPRYEADVVLNQNVHAEQVAYEAAAARVLRGPRWALIRSEYRAARSQAARREVPARARTLLVTMGGSDPDDAAALVIDALERVPGPPMVVTVAVGPMNPRLEALEARAAGSAHDLRVVRAPDLPALMLEADMAVSAAGSTCWELACLGVPSVVIATADNQRAAAVVMGRLFALHAGDLHELDAATLAARITRLRDDAALRRRMSDAGRELVDGEGARRVVDTLLAPVDAR